MIPSRPGGHIDCYRFKSCKAEVQFLVEFLSERVDELPPGPQPKDGIVCLFHSWKALDFYYDQIASNVPCFRRKWLPDPQRQWLRRALQLVCNPQQRYIQRILLEDVPEIKPRHKKAIVQLILERDISPQEAVEALLGDGVLRGAAEEQAGAFIDLCETLSSKDAECIGDHVAAQLGVDSVCASEQLHELLRVLREVDQDDAIEACCDGILPDSVGPVEDLGAVLFLTMHGSKGLTKRVVVMPGLEDAWLPGEASGAELEERRRLFYVALTRATDRVLVTYPKTRALGDPLNYDSPGRGELCRFCTESGISDAYHE
jgi:superfamily I DNA/RNA helicase